MPTTSNRGYSIPAHGTEVDTWDTPLNGNFGLLDNNLGGVSTIALTNINVTLNSAQYQCGTIRLTGTLTGNVLILFPNVSGWWTIDNQTTVGSYYVAARLAAGGNQIGLPDGDAIDVYSDGTNMGYRSLYVAPGGYMDIAASTVPAWITGSTVPPFLNCDGSTFSAVTYPILNVKLGGNTLPDSKGRTRFYLNQGSGRITSAGSGIDGDTLLSAGGAQTVTLSSSQLPIITPAGSISPITPQSNGVTARFIYDSQPTYAVTITGGSLSVYGAADTPLASVLTPTFTGTPFGGGQAHNNMPPTFMSGLCLIRAA